ncbi:MAG: exodeoxyribonuclease V subunit beta [Spirochaetes bacterium]|nr:MAG: exodeoxyribonuclease V subunit beta [Spirochaetota bacterium]
MNDGEGGDMKPFDTLSCPLEGASLIEASAGTGKTHAITGLYLRLIVEKGLRPGQVLVVTFTEAATEELRGRIRTRLRDLLDSSAPRQAASFKDPLMASLAARCAGDPAARLWVQTSLRGFDEAAIYTIHGFCQRMLMDYAFESAALFDTRLVTDEAEMLHTLAMDFLREKMYDESLPLFTEYAAVDKGYAASSALVELYSRTTLMSDVYVRPEAARVEAHQVESALSGLREDYEKAARTWAKDSDEAISLVSGAIEAKDLNGNRYRNFTARAKEMGRYFDNAHPLSDAAKPELFSNAGMQERLNKGKTAPRHPFFTVCDDLCSARAAARGLLAHFREKLHMDFVGYAAEMLRARKSKLNTRSFDDLLAGMHDALRAGGESFLARSVRDRYAAALIDEFQDTDPVQYSIFSTIFSWPGSALFMIGDPKQAIYAFRGADIFAYMKASRGARRRYTLDRNWRSDPELVRAVQGLFGGHPNPFVFGEITLPAIAAAGVPDRIELTERGKKPPPLTVWLMESGDGKEKILKGAATGLAAESTAFEIARLLSRESETMIGDRSLRPADIAVLVRMHHQGEAVHRALSAVGVPSVRYGAGSVFKSDEAIELYTILRAAAEPANEPVIRAAMITDAIGLGADALARLIEDDRAWDRAVTRFHEYRAAWERRGFMHMFRDLAARESVQRNLIALPDGERRVTNIMHLAELAHCAETEKGLGIDGLLKWYTGMIRGDYTGDDSLLRLETDDDAVRIITVHRSKGLEFPVVFCTFAWSTPQAHNGPVSFHDPDMDDRLRISVSADDERAALLAGREDLAEEMRLLYVGITRAKYRCYLAWGPIKDSERSSLAYLLHGAPAAGDPDMKGSLKKIMDTIDPAEIRSALDDIAGRVPGVCITPLPDTDMQGGYARPEDDELCGSREFRGTIPRTWRISSFSMIAAGRGAESGGRDHDAIDFASVPETRAGAFDSIAHFPRGTRAGSMLHYVFERIDFTGGGAGWAPVVRAALDTYGIDAAWESAVIAMLGRVLGAPLDGAGKEASLAAVSPGDRMSELEFFFPLEKIGSPGLSSVLAGCGISSGGGFARDAFPALEFESHRGFLRGFMDLVFKRGERYYLVDWKSNHLGESAADYTPARMLREMQRHRYDLQYMLYTVALNRYLAGRVKDYDYDRNFGGALYLFIRGIDAVEAPGCGVHAARPEREHVMKLDRYLCEGMES